MCCLFGMINYGHTLTGKTMARMLSALSAECEARGTDATGIAYADNGRLYIYKKPLPAHKLRFYLPDRAHVVMGHTRMTTQGSEKKNYNNHPFNGFAGKTSFALAHNGVLHNDMRLRKTLKLPKTLIETDSYIAVQLLEQKKALSYNSLKYMAEKVEGSFTFTVLDSHENLYIIKGDNPMCLFHFPRLGLYLYASTEEILSKAVKRMWLSYEKPVRIDIVCGDILRIDRGGQIDSASFDITNLFLSARYPWFYPGHHPVYTSCSAADNADKEYLSELKSVAASFGYSPEAIEGLLQEGFSTDELEELLYCGEL